MSQDAKPAKGTVRAVLQQLSSEERERLVRALATALIEQIREQKRFDNMRKLI